MLSASGKKLCGGKGPTVPTWETCQKDLLLLLLLLLDQAMRRGKRTRSTQGENT